MIELLSTAGSSGAGAAISLPEQTETFTLFGVASANAASLMNVFIQVADSTSGAWTNLSQLAVAPSGSEVKTLPDGIYVAMRAYMPDSPSPGNVTVKLYSD